MRYPVIVDRHMGEYQITLVDLPGCASTGPDLDRAIIAAEQVMQQWADCVESLGQTVPAPSPLEEVDVPPGKSLASIMLVRSSPNRQNVRVAMTIDAGVLESIDLEAKRRQMSRKAYLEWMTRFVAAHGP
jgi:predicted RNase H-like HicB family nuclease